MVAVKKSVTNKFFENRIQQKRTFFFFFLTFLTLPPAVTPINKGYVKKDDDR